MPNITTNHAITYTNSYFFDSKVIFIIFFNSVRLSECIVLNYLNVFIFLKILIQIVTSVFSPFPKNACVGRFMYINGGHRKKTYFVYKRIIEKQDNLPVEKSLV